MIKIVSIKGSTEFESCPRCLGIHANFDTSLKHIYCTICGRKFKIRKLNYNDKKYLHEAL